MSIDRPAVSVCIPAYNNEDTIADTIRSVLGQTVSDLELVVIDDHSSDATASVVEQFADPRVRLVRNEQNLGMAGNWSKCITEARAPFVKVLCADDILYPTSLQKEIAALNAHPKALLAQSDTALINRAGEKVGAFRRFPKSGRMNGKRLAKISLLFNNFFGAPCNNLFRREAAMSVGCFDATFHYILDFDLWLKLAERGDVVIIHEYLNGFRLRADSNTGEVMGTGERGDRYQAEHELLVDRHKETLGLSPLGVSFSCGWRKLRSRIIHFYLNNSRRRDQK